ncbi:hypothetical protein LMG28727_03313 [Paraburkholderia kirstenboschensis]|nr:hypothetical protein LMG28727_03313 [Paraburkholderia kirstenboschensis]
MRAVAPRMNSTAQNATIAQMQRITVKALISCLEDWKLRLLLLALLYCGPSVHRGLVGAAGNEFVDQTRGQTQLLF